MEDKMRMCIDLSKIKQHCINTECCECNIRIWCNKNLRECKPSDWADFEPEWKTIEYDINENGYYFLESGEPIPHFDYVQGLKRLMTIHNLYAKDVSFGGWFYNESCSWHKSPVLKAEVPCKLRFHIRK